MKEIRNDKGPFDFVAKLLRQERGQFRLVEDRRQFGDFAFECDRQAYDREEVRQFESKLNITHVSLRNAGSFGDCLLRQTTLHADLSHAVPE